MFSTVYQNGEYGIEIFAPSGNEPFKMCKLTNENNIKKVYDRTIKGYMAALEKESSSTFLQIPRSSKSSLGITQPLLIFQIQLHPEKSFALELILLDTDRQKRRFHLSTNFKEVDANNLHVSIPWVQPEREQWTNVAINLIDLITSFSPPSSNLSYFGLESFSIQPVCRLRKIFTLPLKYLGDEDTGLLIPPKYDFTTGVEANSWVFHYTLPDTKTAGHKDQKDPEGAQKTSKLPSKVAEGTKADLMGIVGKKVPQQEATIKKGTVRSANVSKIDASSGDEATHKRTQEKTLPVPVSTTHASNPWSSTGSTAPTPLRKSKRNQEEKEGEKEEVHLVVTIEEPMQEEEEVLSDTPTTPTSAVPIVHTSVPVPTVQSVVPVAVPTPEPVLPVPVVEAAVLPVGGIKLSGKLKQKLGAGVTPTPTIAPISTPAETAPEIYEPTVVSESEIVRVETSPLPVSSAQVKNITVQDNSQPHTHALSVDHNNVRDSQDPSLVLASQDFSSIDDFVKNYAAQHDSLLGYASFARVEAEAVGVAQLNKKSTSSTPIPETTEAETEGTSLIPDGVAATEQGHGHGLQDFMQQVKRHERTPSRGKKFADVALSPMPVMPAVPVVPIFPHFAEETHLTGANTDKGIADVSVEESSGVIDSNIAVSDEEEPQERGELKSVSQSRPPTAPTPAAPVHNHSRLGTAAERPSTSTSAAPTRPSTATPHTQEEIIAMHLRLPTPPPTPLPTPLPVSGHLSRPPTALSTEHASIDVEQELNSVPSSRPTTARPVTASVDKSSTSFFAEAAPYRTSTDTLPVVDDTRESRETDTHHYPYLHHPEEDSPNNPPGQAVSYFEQYQERSAAIGQHWTDDIDALLEKLTTQPSSRPSTATSVSKTSTIPPLEESEKSAIRARVASLLIRVEQAEMEYIAEFGFEAFEQHVGFFEEETYAQRQ